MAETTQNYLNNIPLFSSIDSADLESISAKLESISFNAGDVIIREGEPGDCLYLIKQGRVRISAKMEDDEEIILTYLDEGDYFGEMALITGDVRSATVLAEDELKLLKLSKSDFDNIISENPQITISLTHILSERLKGTNKILEERERYYKNKIMPSGSLEDIDVFTLLKFAEENSLTGKIELIQNSDRALLFYEKGQLSSLDYKEKDEDEALDMLLEWQQGNFVIQPKLYDLQSAIESQQELDIEEPSAQQETILEDPVEIARAYIIEKFSDFFEFSGARELQSALNKGFHKFGPYFDVSTDFKIEVTPNLDVQIAEIENWTEKHTLFLAILLRDIVRTLERDLVGMSFWEVNSKNLSVSNWLQANQFFEYYSEASDFIKD